MSIVKCLVVKSCNGYVNVLSDIIVGIINFWDWVFNSKLCKFGFEILTFFVSALTTIVVMSILHPTEILKVIYPAGFILSTMLLLSIIGLSAILIPIYGAVYDCLVDENLKNDW